MFPYKDPTATDVLTSHDALDLYRRFIDREYQRSGNCINAGFTTMEAFSEVGREKINQASISWSAYPGSRVCTSDQKIDNHRLSLQDEYVEWRVERDGVRLSRITFTTLFPQYYQSLAISGVDALLAAVKSLNPNASPTVEEVFGTADGRLLNTSTGRFQAYTQHMPLNPWNNGDKGIMHLIHPANTLTAFFSLLEDSSIPNPGISPGQICQASLGIRDRNSDPRISGAVQSFVRDGRAVTLIDPVGVEIDRLDGKWELAGEPIEDINTESDIWSISHGGRFAVLNVPDGLTMDGNEIITGAQVSRNLFVRARILETADFNLPIWAQRGTIINRNEAISEYLYQ